MRIAGEDEVMVIGDGCGGNEERMLVSVRIRPLNSMEIARNEFSVWECISKTTIMNQNKCFYEFGECFASCLVSIDPTVLMHFVIFFNDR